MDPEEPLSPPKDRFINIKLPLPVMRVIKAFSKRDLLFLLLVIVLISGVLYVNHYMNPRRDKEVYTSDSNVLLVLDASLNNSASPTELTVHFNNPVSIHALEHSFSMTPAVAGKWTIDKNDQTILHYKFTKKYSGPNIYLYFTQGLVSTNHKTLVSNYATYVYVSQQSEQYARVKTVPAGKPITIRSDVKDISIYKSNAYNLLSFLKYELPPDVKRGSYYDGKYTEEKVEHAASERLKNIPFNKENNTITLDPGVYYVEDDMTEPYYIVVNKFGVVFRQDDKQVLVSAFSLSDGKKISDAVTYGLYNLEKGVNLLKDASSSTNTLATIPLSYPTRLDVVIAIYNNEVAFVPVELPSSQADIEVGSDLDTDTKMFLYTDRPIYKPGDTVFVRGIIRQDSDSQYKIPAAGKQIYLQTPSSAEKSDQFLTQTTTVDEYGTFSANFVLPKDYVSNYSSIRASYTPFKPDNYGGTYANFEVIKYIKPEFEIKTAVEKPEYLRSDTIKYTISANTFDGKPLQNKEINYTIYTDNYYEIEKAVYNKSFNITSFGGMCGAGGFGEYFGSEYKTGKVTLNDRGEATVEVKADDKTLLSQKLTLLAKVTDKNKNELVSAVNTVAHAAEYNIFFIPAADKYSAGEEIVLPFYAETLSGDKVKNTNFSYKLVDYQYSSDAPKKDAPVLASGTVTSDDNGKGIVKFTLSKDIKAYSAQLILSSKDSKNNDAQSQKFISIISQADKESPYNPGWGVKISQTYLKISSNQNSFKVNDTVTLTVDSPRDLDVLLTYERGRIYNPRVLHLNQGANTVSFSVTPDLSPSITAVFSFFEGGNYHTEGLSLNVPAMHKLLQIGLSTSKTTYTPNETADLVVTTKDANGTPVAAQLSVGVVDKAIYALRKSATPPIHSSFYYFRPRRTNASSSLTGLGFWGGRGGGGGGGAGNPGTAADVLYWNPNVKTDATGQVRLPIPLLGYKTIWKVQVLGSTISSDFGQADMEFTVTSDIKGARTKIK